MQRHATLPAVAGVPSGLNDGATVVGGNVVAFVGAAVSAAAKRTRVWRAGQVEGKGRDAGLGAANYVVLLRGGPGTGLYWQ